MGSTKNARKEKQQNNKILAQNRKKEQKQKEKEKQKIAEIRELQRQERQREKEEREKQRKEEKQRQQEERKRQKEQEIKTKKQERAEFINALNKRVDCYWQRVENQMAEEARKLTYVKKITCQPKLENEDYISK